MSGPAVIEPVRTTCPYCGVGCGVVSGADGQLSGDPDHPANRGRLCSKGSALGETLSLDDRLLVPQIGGRPASWPEAIGQAAGRFAETIERYGPDSVAFYVSGQLLTEDYYVANKLMKGFIGSANIDTNSRLCMASSVAGHVRAFGEDIVPGCYEDLELADLVVLVGSNLAWCHPILARRIEAARQARPQMRVVNIDPRRTATSDLADTHLGLAPGSDTALFNGLLHWLERHGHRAAAYVDNHTAGEAQTLAAARPFDPVRVAQETGLTENELTEFYTLWAGTERVVTVYSQGVNQSADGTDKVNAILNAHLFTGRIGRPGMGPFSVTGQPNAMGGREVGGMANTLAAHMEIENPRHREIVQRFWNSPRMCNRPGPKAVEMFDRIASGEIRAVWIMATNPVVSLPDADRVKAALETCFTVVSDVTAETDTATHADILLPALAWGEKDGTVTNSERMISRQRAFLPPPGQARADWRIVCDIAAAMGWGEAFDYSGPAAIFREYAALTGAENDGERCLDISGLAGLEDRAWNGMRPARWPVRRGERPSDRPVRFFSEGGFPTPDGRARMVPVGGASQDRHRRRPSQLVLNTGRVRDHWHTLTRTGKSPRLSRHTGEPYAELHPTDARERGIEPASLVSVSNDRGEIRVRALLNDRQRRGSVFVPMHWTGQMTGRGRVDSLVAPVTDPVSGQPDSKRTPVDVQPLKIAWYGFAVLRQWPENPDCAYWARARTRTGWRAELAGDAPLSDPAAFAACLLGAPPSAEYRNAANGEARFAAWTGERAEGVVFLSRDPVACARDWLVAAFDDEDARLGLLAGRAGAGTADDGPMVCVCETVGAGRIRAAIAAGAGTVDAVTVACRAGGNCGSCRPEIQSLIAAHGARQGPPRPAPGGAA